MRTSVTRLGLIFAQAIVIGTVLMTVIAECERLHWRAYLVAQFRVEWLAILLIVSLCLFASQKSKGFMIMGLIAAFLNFSHLWPYYAFHSETNPHHGKTLRLLQMNLNVKNREFAKVTQYVRTVNPDVLLIEELTPEWRAHFAKELKEYPHTITVEQLDSYGIGVYSKAKLIDGHVEYFGAGKHPSIIATLQDLEKPISLLHTHVQGPVKEHFFAWHKEQMELLVPAVRKLKKPIIVSGDMNSNAWTYFLTDLIHKTELIDTQHGRGIHLSWPAPFYWRGWPFPLLSIDHFFVSKEISVSKRELGKSISSDHYPVLLEVGLQN